MRKLIGKLMIFGGVLAVLFSMFLTPFTPSSIHESRLADLASMDKTEWKKKYPDADQLKVLDEMSQSIEETKRAERTADIALIASIVVFLGGIVTWKLPIQSELDNA